MKLVIVESPAKAKTIEKILGEGYVVKSSFGHVRDLAKDGYKNTGVEVDNKYTPHYEISPEKKKVVAELRKSAKTASQVILATDEDREGEAISWHLKEVLALPDKKTQRITFTEITPPAIQAAIENPRDVDVALVNAQQARRVLDRLVGFELSGLLWKKVRGKLSAGRVQSVAVKLVVERERDIMNFKPSEQYKVTGVFTTKGKAKLPAELSEVLKDKATAEKFLHNCIKADFTISSVKKSPSTRKPNAPFTTSTLQQFASHRLGFSVTRTMSTAQRLYEQGHITYMRTDSISISNIALGSIGSYIEENYGKDYLTIRKFKSSSKLAQEAHEAIRPTYIAKTHVSENRDEQKLYELIRSRTMASQMADAKVEKTDVIVTISTEKKHVFEAHGEIIIFDGFLKLYKDSPQGFDDVILPDLEEGDKLEYKEIFALQRFTKPTARFTEATLVKKLEELGIGRPSTYAPTIDKITSPTRGYVTKETREGTPTTFVKLVLKSDKISEEGFDEVAGAQKNKLFAKDMGIIVTDFLDENFKEIMHYTFTAEVEDKLDDIAAKKEEWVKVVDTYYKPFLKVVEEALKVAGRATGEKELGKDPKSGRTIIVRMSKYGPVVQIGTPDELKEEEKPQYAGLMPNQHIDTITLEDALQLFELPRNLGMVNDKEVIVNRGRFGPYIKYGEDFISIPRDKDLFAIKLSEAKVIVEEKMKEKAPIGNYEEKPITKGVGRFGPFIKWNNMYVSISKRSGFALATITEDEAIKLIKEKEVKEAQKLMREWPEEGLRILKGRWGPFIKKNDSKKFYPLPKNAEGKRMTEEEIAKLTLEEVKKMIGKK